MYTYLFYDTISVRNDFHQLWSVIYSPNTARENQDSDKLATESSLGHDPYGLKMFKG